MVTKFRVRFGFRGRRTSTFAARTVVGARAKFKKRRPRAKIDSIEMIRK